MLDALSHRVGRSLEPEGIVRSLLGGQNIHEPAAENVEFIGLDDVLVQRRGVGLGQDKDLIDAE